MAAARKTAPEETEEVVQKENEYFELRIPKISNGRVPFIITLLLMVLSYIAGYLTPNIITQMRAGNVISTAPDAFISYAKQLKLDTKKFTSCMEEKKYGSAITTDIDNGTASQVSATPTFFINGRILVGAQPYSLFQQMIEQEISGVRSPLTEEEGSASAQIDVANGHLPILGDQNAKITIVEFSDFQCPFCESFFTSTFPELKKNYIDTGKVKLAFRHYPLTSIHPNAETAHNAAECANEQGKFWEYHDLLFKNQPTWSELPLEKTTPPAV